MIESLAEALRALKEGAANGAGPPVLTADALASRLHGLTLDQVVKLTDLPALAVALMLRTPQGAVVERFLVDGRDAPRREALARQLLLDGDLANETAVREALEFDLGVLRHRLARDRQDVVYRADGGQAGIDEELTAVLRGRRPPAAPARHDDGLPALGQPVVIEDVVAFSGIAGEILHGLAELHASHRAAFAALSALGEGRSPDAAAEAAAAAIGRGEETIARLQRHVAALLRLADQAASASAPAEARASAPD